MPAFPDRGRTPSPAGRRRPRPRPAVKREPPPLYRPEPAAGEVQAGDEREEEAASTGEEQQPAVAGQVGGAAALAPVEVAVQNKLGAGDAEAIKARCDVPVVVDFWASWCGPCKMMEVPLDELAEEHAGKLNVAKLNVDQNPATSSRYSVMSLPMLLFFRDGKVVDTAAGALPRQVVEQHVWKFLA